MAGPDKTGDVGKAGGSRKPEKLDPKAEATQIGQKVLATAVDLLGEKVVGKYKNDAFKFLSSLAEQHLGKSGIGKDLADAGIKILSDAADRLTKPPKDKAPEDAIIGETAFKELESGLFQISGGNAARESHAIHDLLGIAGLDNKTGFGSTIKDLITGAAKLDLRLKSDWKALGSKILMAALATPGGWQAKLAAAGVALGDGVIGGVEVGVKKKEPKGEAAAPAVDAKAEAEAKKTVGGESYTLAPLPTNGEEKAYNPMAALLGQMISTRRTVGGTQTEGNGNSSGVQFVSNAASAAKSSKGEAAKAKADQLRRELVSADAITAEVVKLLGGKATSKGAGTAAQLLMRALDSVKEDGGDQLNLMLSIQRVMLDHAKEQGLPADQIKRLEALAEHTGVIRAVILGNSNDTRINFSNFSPAFTGMLNRLLLGSVIELVQQATGLRSDQKLGVNESFVRDLMRAIDKGEFGKSKGGEVAYKKSKLFELLHSSYSQRMTLKGERLPPVKLEEGGPEIALTAEKAGDLASGLAHVLKLPEGSSTTLREALEKVFRAAGEKVGDRPAPGILSALLQAYQELAPRASNRAMDARDVLMESHDAISLAESGLRESRPILEQAIAAQAEYEKRVKDLSKKAATSEGGASAALDRAKADLDKITEKRRFLEAKISDCEAAAARGREQLQIGISQFLAEFAQATIDPAKYNGDIEAAAKELEAKLGKLWSEATGKDRSAKAAQEILNTPEFAKAVAQSEHGPACMKLLQDIAAGKVPPEVEEEAKKPESQNLRDFTSAGKGDGKQTIAQQRYQACREVLADPSLSIQDKMLYFLFIFALYTDKEREASMDEFTQQDKAQADWKANEKTLNQRVDECKTTMDGLQEELNALKGKAESEKATLATGVSPETQNAIKEKEEALDTAQKRHAEASSARDEGVKDMGANAKNQDIMFMNLERITQRYTQLLQLINSLLEKSDRLIEKLSR